MALAEMKRTKADKKVEKERYDSPSSLGGSDYHHGLSVHLDHESLAKLGITKLPTVGSKMTLHAHAHVKSAEESHSEGGKPRRSVSLELRKMELAAEQKAAQGDVQEGNLTGAKAAMDQALDAQETGKKSRRKSGSTGRTGESPEGAGEED